MRIKIVIIIRPAKCGGHRVLFIDKIELTVEGLFDQLPVTIKFFDPVIGWVGLSVILFAATHHVECVLLMSREK